MADALAGALGGITGPLAAFPGAGVTIWCGMRGWDKVEQRAVYQPYILIMQLIGVSTLYLLQPHSISSPRCWPMRFRGWLVLFWGCGSSTR